MEDCLRSQTNVWWMQIFSQKHLEDRRPGDTIKRDRQTGYGFSEGGYFYDRRKCEQSMLYWISAWKYDDRKWKYQCLLCVPEESFCMEVYTEIYAQVKGAEKLTAFTDQYDQRIDSVMKEVEAIKEERRRHGMMKS